MPVAMHAPHAPAYSSAKRLAAKPAGLTEAKKHPAPVESSSSAKRLAPPRDGKFINWDTARERTKNAIVAAFNDALEPWAMPAAGRVAVRLATPRPPAGTLPPRPKG